MNLTTLYRCLRQSQLSVALLSVLLLNGCAFSHYRTSQFTDMERIALCQGDKKTQAIEKKITAEYGFKRFTKDTYRPVLDRYLFGHQVRVIELGKQRNKLYVAGNPREFGHHFKWLLKEVNCDKKGCQAPLSQKQTLHIYKINLKKAKDTTVIECTKPPSA